MKIVEVKTCIGCQQTLALSRFSQDYCQNTGKARWRPRCRECTKVQADARKAAKYRRKPLPKIQRESEAWWLTRKMGGRSAEYLTEVD